MFTKFLPSRDDVLALFGIISVLAGIYLWLGLPAALILLGVILLIIAWRLPEGDA